MDGHNSSPRWHRAAADAAFVIFGPRIPEPRSVRAGGVGYSGGAPNHLGVVADIDGAEVAVDTALRREHAAGLARRARIADAIWHFMLSDATDIELPLQIEIVPENRTVAVAGTATAFTGIRVVGSARWSGTATIDDVLITVTTTDPAVVTAIDPIEPRDIPELPPNGLAS